MGLEQYFQPGQRVFVGGATNEPQGLLAELSTLELPHDLRFVQFPIGGLNATDFTTFNATASIETFFMTPTLARADADRVHFVPMHMRWVYDHLLRDIDVALVQVARDSNGQLRLGPNADFIDAVLSTARVVVAELNHGFTAPAGCPRIAASRIDYIHETDRPLPQLKPPTVDPVAQEIGRLVAELIADGDCIQTGIGAIPAAILSQLTDKNDLGLHGGLIDDGGMALIQAGNVNGSHKTIDRGLHVTGMGLGTQALFDWLADTPSVIFRGANHTHDAGVIRQLHNFVSINSAVQIDLHGQVNAEVANGRQLSGTGGSVDFMRAARGAPGGRSIVAMNATAKGGQISRIVPQVELTTALRTDVDIVVTEYGVAHLQGLPSAARAAALIELAAPQFRAELLA